EQGSVAVALFHSALYAEARFYPSGDLFYAVPRLFFDLPFESTDCPAHFRSIRDGIEDGSAVECADCDYGGFQRLHSTGYDGLELLDQRGCSNYRIDCVM